MQPYYRLSNSAGMVRSNKFADKADAICVATYRAESLAWPVKIYEHTVPGDSYGTCVLVCMPDGSAKAPVGSGLKMVDLGNETSGARNNDEAYMLLSAYDEMPITTFYLKSELSESLAAEMEKEFGVELGLYDPRTLHAYTEDSDKIKKLEGKLAEASVEVERVKDSKVRKEKLEASAELVTSARKGHMMARAARMPEMSVRASLKFGSGLRVQCHCEMVEAAGKNAPKIKVYADGRMVGEVKSEREASAIMSDYAERAFQKFLKKELA
jgi:hypothetical protein